jgi:hypothetical protein
MDGECVKTGEDDTLKEAVDIGLEIRGRLLRSFIAILLGTVSDRYIPAFAKRDDATLEPESRSGGRTACGVLQGRGEGSCSLFVLQQPSRVKTGRWLLIAAHKPK